VEPAAQAAGKDEPNAPQKSFQAHGEPVPPPRVVVERVTVAA